MINSCIYTAVLEGGDKCGIGENSVGFPLHMGSGVIFIPSEQTTDRDGGVNTSFVSVCYFCIKCNTLLHISKKKCTFAGKLD